MEESKCQTKFYGKDSQRWENNLFDRNKVITEEKDVIKKSEDHFENSFFDKFSILRSLF